MLVWITPPKLVGGVWIAAELPITAGAVLCALAPRTNAAQATRIVSVEMSIRRSDVVGVVNMAFSLESFLHPASASSSLPVPAQLFLRLRKPLPGFRKRG